MKGLTAVSSVGREQNVESWRQVPSQHSAAQGDSSRYGDVQPPCAPAGGVHTTRFRDAVGMPHTALSTEEITPLLYSGSLADFFAGYRQQKQGEHGLTDDDLRNWKPPAATRGRRTAVKK